MSTFKESSLEFFMDEENIYLLTYVVYVSKVPEPKKMIESVKSHNVSLTPLDLLIINNILNLDT